MEIIGRTFNKCLFLGGHFLKYLCLQNSQETPIYELTRIKVSLLKIYVKIIFFPDFQFYHLNVF